MKRANWGKPACIAALALSFGALSGCGASVVRGSDKPKIDNPALSVRFDQKDVNQIVGKMVDGLLSSAFFAEATGGPERPRIAIDELVNETDQHLNTEEILTLIQGKVLNTRKMMFVDKAARERAERELGMQLREVVARGTAAQIGKQLGFRYFLTGKIWSVTERLKGVKRVQYRVVLKVLDIETLAIEWQAEESLTKQMQ